jgi:hypothetical protein
MRCNLQSSAAQIKMNRVDVTPELPAIPRRTGESPSPVAAALPGELVVVQIYFITRAKLMISASDENDVFHSPLETITALLSSVRRTSYLVIIF